MTNVPRFCLAVDDGDDLLDLAPQVFDLVWRVDFTAPGFAVVDLPSGLGSRDLRFWMVDLKGRLNEISVIRGRAPLAYKSMGRFNQQETTKFHLDGAPDQSFLMLGYEPSKVYSRLFLADYTRAAFNLGITPKQFLVDFNPMYKRGEVPLAQYITELPQPGEGQPRILIINNSSLPFTEDRAGTLGVMHKAIIESPDEAERRIVNSTMLAIGPSDDISDAQQQEFITTDRISRKIYQE